MTGAELKAVFEQRADTAYSSYWSDAQLNRAFASAFIQSIENIYKNRLVKQSEYDALSYLIAIDQVYPVGANTIAFGSTFTSIATITYVGTLVTVNTLLPHDMFTGMSVTFSGIIGSGTIVNLNGQSYPITVTGTNSFTFTASFAPTGVATPINGIITPLYAVPDYYHFLYGKARFTSPIENTVIEATNTSPIRITLLRRGRIREGDQVLISGIVGNTAANGTPYVKQLNDTQYLLYSDAKLKTPVSGNGGATTQGVISQIFYSSLRCKVPDQKGTVLGSPTVENPFFQQGKLYGRMLPLTETCDEVTLDYIRKPLQQVDVADASINFSNWYNEDFQYELVDRAVKLFAESTRDGSLLSIETSIIEEQK